MVAYPSAGRIAFLMLENQPISCRQPLPLKEWGEEYPEVFKRVVSFDPAEVYERIAAEGGSRISPFKRYNTIFIGAIFPFREDGLCGCGCGQQLTGRRTRWATKECSSFATRVYWIIYGSMEKGYRQYIYHYYNFACSNCGDMSSELQIDHVIPVHAGGGLCWLSNLRPLCIECHKEKTKADRKLYSS